MNTKALMKPNVTIRQVSENDGLYKSIEKDLMSQCNESADTLRNLFFGEDTQVSSPKLWVISSVEQVVGYVITFDFYQATYITTLYINEEFRREGFGSMLLEHISDNPNRTYVLLTQVAMSDSDMLSVCVRRKIFYLKNGFRTVPIKWRYQRYYRWDVHVKGPDLELGSLLAVLRKGEEIWRTAYVVHREKNVI